jgi:hypothetical protein
MLVLSSMLSAACIPLSVAWIEHHHGSRISATATAISIMAVLGSFLFSMYTHLKAFGQRPLAPRRADDFTLESILSRPYTLGGGVRVVAGKTSRLAVRLDAILSDGDTLAEQLLAELDAIECTAQVLIGERRRISVIRIRPRLLELGIWSERDICDFNDALRVRTRVVRREMEKPTTVELATAVSTLQHLRWKMIDS